MLGLRLVIRFGVGTVSPKPLIPKPLNPLNPESLEALRVSNLLASATDVLPPWAGPVLAGCLFRDVPWEVVGRSSGQKQKSRREVGSTGNCDD